MVLSDLVYCYCKVEVAWKQYWRFTKHHLEELYGIVSMYTVSEFGLYLQLFVIMYTILVSIISYWIWAQALFTGHADHGISLRYGNDALGNIEWFVYDVASTCK